MTNVTEKYSEIVASRMKKSEDIYTTEDAAAEEIIGMVDEDIADFLKNFIKSSQEVYDKLQNAWKQARQMNIEGVEHLTKQHLEKYVEEVVDYWWGDTGSGPDFLVKIIVDGIAYEQ